MFPKIARILLPVLLLLAPLSCRKIEVGPSADCAWAPGSEHPKATAYQKVLDDYVASGLPGISILIRDAQGTWVGSAGKADIAENIPMRPCTVGKVASLTKSFMGVLALRLVEQGRLGLDDPIADYLPADVVDEVKNARESTVRMLMNHSSGIADVVSDQSFYLAVLNNPPKKWDPMELVRFVYGDDPFFTPAGNGVHYSNTNTLLMAMIIDKITGDHSKALREMVIDPIGLPDTYYYWHEALPPTVAQGYFDLYNNGLILNMSNYNTGSGNGYTGLYSTVFDLQTFIEALVRDKTVLSQAMLDQMLTFTEPEGDTNRSCGLGLVKDFLDRAPDEFAYGHRGRDLGYTADMFWFPNQDYTICYIINYGTDANSTLREVFYDFRVDIVDALME